MLTVEVCVGSSCYLRGAQKVVDTLRRLIEERALRDVTLKGTFCLERCTDGVTVRIGDRIFAGIKPDDAESFFAAEIESRL